MIHINRRFSSIVISILLTVFLLTVGLAFAEGGSTTASTDGIDEIVVVGTDGYVYAYNANGQQVFKSAETGWKMVATADFNGDGDAEIIAVNDKSIKVYDPQIVGTAFSFSTAYSGNGAFVTVHTGDFWNDGTPDIALIFNAGTTNKHIVIYDDASSTTPTVDQTFLMADDFAVGDYDGDGDDDFAVIAWNNNNPSGAKSWFELREGRNPTALLNNATNAGVYNDSQWFDIASGNFDTNNGARQEWVGAQNLGENITVQRWNTNNTISTIWQLTTPFNYVAVGNFRNEAVDQVAMLRNVTSGTSLQFTFKSLQDGQVKTWASISGLGTGWLNMATGNVDGETPYLEAVAIKNNLIRVYLRPQSVPTPLGGSTYLDCNTAGNCFESFALTSNLNGALAVADIGITFDTITPFSVSPTTISRSMDLSQTVPSATFYIYGDDTNNQPITWRAYVLPYDARAAAYAKSVFRTETNLGVTITGRGIETFQPEGTSIIPTQDWLTLSTDTAGPGAYISGTTTPATVTVTFSNTYPSSPLGASGVYKALIQVQNMDTLETTPVVVSIFVGGNKVYLPLVIK